VNLNDLLNRAKKVARRTFPSFQGEVRWGNGAYTDGNGTIVLPPPPDDLPDVGRREWVDVLSSHEARHIRVFRRHGFASAEEFFRRYADPLSPDEESVQATRDLLNLIEDSFVDELNVKDAIVTRDAQDRVHRRIVFERLKRVPLTALERQNRFEAFMEAFFEREVYGTVFEPYVSKELLETVEKAMDVVQRYRRGEISREEALRRIIEIVKQYAPPPWKVERVSPRPSAPSPQGGSGGGGGTCSSGGGAQGGGQQGQQSQGQGQGNQGQKGQGQQGQQGGQSSSQGQQSQGNQGQQSGSSGSSGQGQQNQGGQGQGYTQNPSPSRGYNPDGAADGKRMGKVQRKKSYSDLAQRLLSLFEKTVKSLKKGTRTGTPRFERWRPGDLPLTPEEVQRWGEGEVLRVPPKERRCIVRRYKKALAIIVFIDSSGSIGERMYRAFLEITDDIVKIMRSYDVRYFGFGFFSDNAKWVVPLTLVERDEDAKEIRRILEDAEYVSGGTCMSSALRVIRRDVEPRTDVQRYCVLVLTDGYIEGPTYYEAEKLSEYQKLHRLVLGIMNEANGGTTIPSVVRKWKEAYPTIVRVYKVDRQ